MKKVALEVTMEGQGCLWTGVEMVYIMSAHVPFPRTQLHGSSLTAREMQSSCVPEEDNETRLGKCVTQGLPQRTSALLSSRQKWRECSLLCPNPTCHYSGQTTSLLLPE